jgi:hypothetical protein
MFFFEETFQQCSVFTWKIQLRETPHGMQRVDRCTWISGFQLFSKDFR